MDFFSVLTMIGGLALFLYGMNSMGDGLAKLSGGRLEQILEKLTSNKLKAVLLGAGVTAVIQSSSATTVMVVGFVNSGIMKLSQAIGIIMGANIGTTITSWILSLTGIESSSFFIKLLKPSSFSPVLALIGMIFILFSKKEKKRDIGTILVGFAILMTGMEIMSDAVKPLAEVESFTNILTAFSNPILGMIAGAVLTAVIQSSSASVGILQALCITGSVRFSVALPIIMGQNIGTCITAIISGIGASKNAKRAALVHLYFNLIGTICFMAIFYSVNVFVDFAFLDTAADATGIAVLHSLFNVFATILMLPFTSGLERLANMTIRDDEEEKPKDILDCLEKRFLEIPSYAIEQSKHVANEMMELSRESMDTALELINEYDSEKAARVIELENTIDRFEDELGTYLIQVGTRDITNEDNHKLNLILHCIGDIERISDHAVGIVKVIEKKEKKSLEFSAKASAEINVLASAVRDIISTSCTVFENNDIDLAKDIEPLEEVTDHLNKQLKKHHLKRLRKEKCTVELGFIYTDIIASLEKAADHCSNIAVNVISINDNGYDTHEYLDTTKNIDNGEFNRKYEEFKARYVLP